MNFCAQLIDTPEYKDYNNQNEAFRDFDICNSIKNIIQPTLILSGSKDMLSIPGMAENFQFNIRAYSKNGSCI